MTAGRVRKRAGHSRGTLLITNGYLFLMAAYFLLPIFWLIIASTKTQSGLITGYGPDLTSGQFWTNIGNVFTEQNGIYVRWLLNSAVYAGVGAGGGTILAAMAGYALSKYDFAGREMVAQVILAGILVPATVLALPLFLMFAKIGETDSYWAVLLPSLVSPFGVYLARIYATASLPDDVLSAARLDGAGEARIFVSIATRLMTPALVTIFLFQFVAIWNNFFLPLIMLQNSKLYPITLGLFTWQSEIPRDAHLQILTIVGSLISIVPLIIAFVALQRFWRSGLGAGSVK